MSAQFCMKCGTALPPGAMFCSNCGSPTAVPGAGAPAAAPFPSGVPPPSPGPATAPPADLSGSLGLAGRKNFLVQHEALSIGHSYRVMDHEKRLLFTVQGNAKQNLMGNLVGGMFGGGGNSYMERMATRGGGMTYSLVHPSGTVVGTVTKEGGPNRSTFTLTDAAGQRWVTVHLERGMMGGITATAVSPTGQPILQTSGNLVRHDFMIKDPGGRDVVKVHEAWAAVRDTYNVDLLGNVDPLYPLVFSILIDFEKVK